jgi:hypothetical protein
VGSQYDTVLAIVIMSSLTLAGGFSTIRGYEAFRRTRTLRATAPQTVGRIVDNEPHVYQSAPYSGIRIRLYRPVIEYTTHLGLRTVAVCPNERLRRFTVGAQVPIRYDPDDPSYIEITQGKGRGSFAGRQFFGSAISTLIFLAGLVTVFVLIAR